MTFVCVSDGCMHCDLPAGVLWCEADEDAARLRFLSENDVDPVRGPEFFEEPTPSLLLVGREGYLQLHEVPA